MTMELDNESHNVILHGPPKSLQEIEVDTVQFGAFLAITAQMASMIS